MSERIARRERRAASEKCLGICPYIGSIACPRYTATVVGERIRIAKGNSSVSMFLAGLTFDRSYKRDLYTIAQAATEHVPRLMMIEAGAIARIQPCLDAVQNGDEPIASEIDETYFLPPPMKEEP